MRNFLTDTERAELKIRHRAEKDRRSADRIKAVWLSDKGWTFKQISEALLLDEESVSKHVSEYNEHKKLSIETGGSKSKLDEHQTKALISHLEEHTYLKSSEICEYVQKSYGIQYTVPGMTSWLQNNGFSYKQPKATPAKADPVLQAAFIKAYNALLNATSEAEPVLFIDGVHPTMATKITYGWIKRGENKPISTTASRTRMNIMGALNLETMGVDVKEYETIDSRSMVDYWSFLRQKYPKAPKIHVILDRGPYNISEQTKESAKDKRIVLHYLPPYSPNLNPIERLWKVMNEYVRNNRFFESAQEFRLAIRKFFNKTWNRISMTMIDRINDNFQTLHKSKV